MVWLDHAAMRILALLLLLALAWSVEVPAVVKHVTDGDTIGVTLEGGAEAKVRLLYVDTPESKDNSHGEAKEEGKKAAEFLTKLLPVGTKVSLVGPAKELEKDRYQRILAVVFIPTHEGLSGPPTIVQEAIIRAGWSPLWEKYGKVSFDWRPRLVKAQEEAKEAKAGAWGTDPKYMQDKANETTAPRIKE